MWKTFKQVYDQKFFDTSCIPVFSAKTSLTTLEYVCTLYAYMLVFFLVEFAKSVEFGSKSCFPTAVLA